MATMTTLPKSAGLSPTVHRTSDSAKSTASRKSRSLSERRTISPTKRTTRWLEAPSPFKDAPLHRVKGSGVAKPNKDKHNHKRRSSFWGLQFLANMFGRQETPEVDDLEGDTYVAGDDPIPSIEHDNDSTLLDDEIVDEENVKLERTESTLKDYRSDHYIDYNDPRIREWTSEEIWFFHRLRNRGGEPLFDQTWTMDFPTFPDSLFTRDASQVFFDSNACSIFRAVQAFSNLCRAGALVRGQISSNAIPEKPLLREIASYHKWSLQDGNLARKAHIPVTAIASARPRESTESVVARVTDQLHDLGRRYRDEWRHPDCSEHDLEQKYIHPLPTMFGFVIKYTVVAVVTYDASVLGKPIRTLLTTDWRVVGQDVWHALAIAIAFVRQRNYLMQLDKDGLLGSELVEDESDPDA